MRTHGCWSLLALSDWVKKMRSFGVKTPSKDRIDSTPSSRTSRLESSTLSHTATQQAARRRPFKNTSSVLTRHHIDSASHQMQHVVRRQVCIGTNLESLAGHRPHQSESRLRSRRPWCNEAHDKACANRCIHLAFAKRNNNNRDGVTQKVVGRGERLACRCSCLASTLELVSGCNWLTGPRRQPVRVLFTFDELNIINS